jgi:hypothetical protein
MIIFAIAVMLIKLQCQLHCNSKDAINFITPKKLRKNTTRCQFEGATHKAEYSMLQTYDKSTFGLIPQWHNFNKN